MATKLKLLVEHGNRVTRRINDVPMYAEHCQFDEMSSVSEEASESTYELQRPFDDVDFEIETVAEFTPATGANDTTDSEQGSMSPSSFITGSSFKALRHTSDIY